MTRKVPNIRIPGIRLKTPQGYFAGRADKGLGRMQLISSAEMKRMLGLTPGEIAGIIAAQVLPTVGFYALGAMDANEWLGQVVFTRTVIFPANFAGAQGVLRQLATASTVVTAKKFSAGVLTTVGTITWPAATEDANFATTGGLAITFNAGDVLDFYGQATPDATARDFVATIPGSAP